MAISFNNNFYIRPRATFENKNKHLLSSKKYAVVGTEEVYYNVCEKVLNKKGKLKNKTVQKRKIIYYVTNELSELTPVDNVTIEILDIDLRKTHII